MDIHELEYELLKVLYDNRRIQLLADRVEALTGYPVYFTSVNWDALARSPGVHPEELVKKSALFSGKQDKRQFYQEYCEKKAEITHLIAKSPCIRTIHGVPYLFANAALDSSHVGTVVFPRYPKAFEEINRPVLDVILRVFAVCVSASLGYLQNISNTNWERILLKLINHSITDISTLEHEIKGNSEITAPSRFRIYVLRIRGIDITLTPAYKQLSDYFQGIQVFRCWIQYEGCIVLLSDDQSAPSEEPVLLQDSAFLRLIRENGILLGYSEASGRLLDCADLYYQAKTAAHFADRWNAELHVGSYESCKLYDLLYHVQSPTGSLQLFMSDSVQLIQEYDQAHDTRYMSILTTLVSNRFSLTNTANQLFIHKSTLNYHMKKMSALFQIDWDDLEQMLHVQLTLFMMQTFLKN